MWTFLRRSLCSDPLSEEYPRTGQVFGLVGLAADDATSCAISPILPVFLLFCPNSGGPKGGHLKGGHLMTSQILSTLSKAIPHGKRRLGFHH